MNRYEPLQTDELIDGQVVGNRQRQEIITKREMSQQANLGSFMYIRMFAQSMLKYKRYLSQLTTQQLTIINDLASSSDLTIIKQNSSTMRRLSTYLIEQDQLKWTQSIIQISKSIIERCPLVSPESQFKFYWDCLMLLPRVYFMMMIPIDLSWHQNEFLYDTLVIPTTISLLMLILDVIFRCFQSYYHEGNLITDRYQIFISVISRAKYIEITSLIIQCTYYTLDVYLGWTLNVNEQPLNLIILFACVQHYNINMMRQQLEDSFNLSKTMIAIIELVKLLFLICYIIHLFACLWWWVGYYSNLKYNKSWINNNNRDLTNLTFGDQYMYSFYFSTVTMFTVGYGDITPQSYPEHIIDIIFMLICSIQLAYSVHTIGGILCRMTVVQQEKQQALNVMNKYMHDHGIPRQLQYQVRDYLNYYINQEAVKDTELENKYLDKLSTELKNKLIQQANENMISSVEVFRGFSKGFLVELSKCIKQTMVLPQTIIPSQKAISYITSGQVEAFVDNSELNIHETIIGTIGEGQQFGLEEFMSEERTTIKYRSKGFTKLQVLDKDTFINCLQDYPEDYEKFRYKLKHPYLSCIQCSSKRHTTIQCPMTHFIPDSEFVIKKSQISIQQQRKPIHRQSSKKLRLHRLISQAHLEQLTHKLKNKFKEEISLYRQPSYEIEEIDDFQSEAKMILHGIQKAKSKNSDVQDQIENLMIKVTNEINPQIDDLDIAKNYLHYSSEDNLENLLPQVNRRSVPERINTLMKFAQYMRYPYEFLKRFKR